MSNSFFENRSLLIATKHGKEKIIAPLLEKNFDVKCFVDVDFDTDTLGTFTGEIERKLDPIANARQKCLLAMEANNCDLGMASEGSFGPHPTLFFASADDEFLIFIDKKNDLEIIVRELSTDTNFNSSEIKNEQELLAFAEQAKFPSHGLILRKSKTDFEDIIKEIPSLEALKKAFHRLQKKQGSIYAETDMRAHYNPTRMEVIEKAAQKLVDKIKSRCPECSAPGFGVTSAIEGLPCSSCGSPTRSTLSYEYRCQKCNFTQEKLYPHKKTTEDPTFCDYCNP